MEFGNFKYSFGKLSLRRIKWSKETILEEMPSVRRSSVLYELTCLILRASLAKFSPFGIQVRNYFCILLIRILSFIIANSQRTK